MRISFLLPIALLTTNLGCNDDDPEVHFALKVGVKPDGGAYDEAMFSTGSTLTSRVDDKATSRSYEIKIAGTPEITAECTAPLGEHAMRSVTGSSSTEATRSSKSWS